MPDISVQFDVVDRFSSAMEKFSSMVESCSGGADKLAESASNAGDKLSEVSDKSLKGSMQFKGFGASMMVVNQALQAFQRLAEPVKQALDDIAQKQRVLVMFGNEAGNAFNNLAKDAAMSLGRVEGEVRKAGLKWQKIGIGGENIMELTRLADRFANLNPDRSFEEVADAFRDAIKSKDVGGLADLLGGGEGVELKLRRSGVERMMRSGNISGALQRFKDVADQFGYTQDKADEMGMTIDKKLAKIANIGRNYITDMFSDIVAKAEPYVNKILEWLQSEDVQEALQKTQKIVGLIADGFFKLVKWVIIAAKGIYDFVSRNKDIIATSAAIFGVFWAFSKIPVVITSVITAVKSLTGAMGLLHSATFAIPLAIVGVGLAFQKIFNYVTGESVSFIETLVGIFVGGTVQIVMGVVELAQRLWNSIVDINERASNWIIEGIESFINGIIDDVESLRNTILEIVKGIVDDVISAIDGIASSGLGEKLGLNDALSTLKEVSNELAKVHNTKMDRVKFAREDYSKAKADIVDSVELSGKAIGFVMDKINGIKADIQENLFGKDGDLQDIVSQLDILSQMEDDLSKIRGSMQKEQDLRWMKEMAEQRFVNEVNLRQLTPTINLRVTGSGSPQENAKYLAKELQKMADAGTFNAYGNV